MDSIGGVVFAKILNLFRRKKISPMIGAAGISAFPMSSRVIKNGDRRKDPQNFMLSMLLELTFLDHRFCYCWWIIIIILHVII